jgi:hypothetical protein
MSNNETDPDVTAFLASRPFSAVYKANVQSTVRMAESVISGKRLRDWTNDDGLAFKQKLEERMKGARSALVKWGQMASIFKWLCLTGRAPRTPEGLPVATAGIELAYRVDPKMPTLALPDFLRLIDNLEATARVNVSNAVRARHQEILAALWKDRAEEAEFVRRVVLLQWEKGLRGGEILPTARSRPKTICDCTENPGEPCPRTQKPHDFRIIPQADGRSLVWIRIKGEPKRLRFKDATLSAEETVWLREIVAHPRLILRSYVDRLKGLQEDLGLRLVDRTGAPMPTATAPLTSHTIRRSVARELNKLGISEGSANKKFGWSTKSQQFRRYGEPSPSEVDEAGKDVLDLARVRRRLRKPSDSAEKVGTDSPKQQFPEGRQA